MMDGLQFKPWLIQQISSGNFLDLEWIDAEKRRIFKLPWTKKNYPNWEEHHEIFRAWAKHRSKIKNEPEALNQHISLMKSNFRTILNKCHELEEQTNLHQLGLQTGNYKVYKVLDHAEAKMKRKRVKHPILAPDPCEDMIEISATNGETLDFTAVGTAVPNIDTEWIEASSSLGIAFLDQNTPEEMEPSIEDAPKPKRKKILDSPPNDPSFVPREIIFVKDNSIEDNPSTEVIITEEPIQDMEELEITEENTDGFQILLEAAEMAAEGKESILHILAKQTQEEKRSCLLHILSQLQIPEKDLFTYKLQVKYEQTVVKSDNLTKMKVGYRLHYGDHADQRYLVRIDEPKRTELIVDFDRHPITLPDPGDNYGGSFMSVINNMDAGVVFKCDNDFNLKAKRLCQSRIFAFTSFGEQDDDFAPIQMARDEDVELFTYSKFWDAWVSYAKGFSPMPDCTVLLCVGKKPRQRISKVFVSASLVPKAADRLTKWTEKALTMREESDDREDSVSRSLDELLSMLR